MQRRKKYIRGGSKKKNEKREKGGGGGGGESGSVTYYNRAYSREQACTNDCSDKMLIMAQSIAAFWVVIN
jgi:hypothetical protein